MKPTIIIDGGYLAHRTKSIPFFRNMVVNEKRVGLGFGMMNTIKKLVNEGYENFKIAWDKGSSTHRKKISKTYKSSRKEATKPKIMVDEWGFAETLLGFFGVEQYYHPDLEADDIMGYFAEKLEKPLHIFTVDKDLYQMVDDDVLIYHPDRDCLIEKDDVIEEFGVEPKKIPILLAVAGDRADDIKGVEGIGYKTASKYINEGISSLTERQCNLILENGDIIEKNLKLTKLKVDTVPKMIRYNKDFDEFKRMIDEYSMSSLEELITEDKNKSIGDFVR